MRLLRVARDLIRQVNAKELVIDHWTFGGGTAMMLQIGHRASRDVDIFLTDAQQLPFLDPQTHDFTFDLAPTDCTGDGIRFLRLVFENIGEIDFIVAAGLTPQPSAQTEIDGDLIALETVPEIIAKKIHYRGASLKPRDIFDIAAAGETDAASVVRALRPYKGDVAQALVALQKLNPDFVRAAIAELAIKSGYETISKDALQRATELLTSV